MQKLAEQLEPPVTEEELTSEAPAEATESPPETPPQEVAEKPEQEKEKFVPHGAFHEEREKRKDLQRQLARVQQEQAQRDQILNDRLQQIYHAANPPQQLRDPNSDPDPLSAMQHNQQLTAQQLANLQNRIAQDDWNAQQAAQTQALVNWAQGQAAEFARETDDFSEAYGFMLERRHGELAAMGLPPQEVKRVLENDEMWIFQTAYQTGRNPGEIVYNMAKANGFQKKIDKPSAETKIETLQKGTQAAKTLGNGGTSAGMPTPEQIAAMSDDEFAEFKEKLSAKGKRISDVI